uniref:Uncharacterized protein n=1 Tax=Corethron hystrix TaxID=216773 RepID=A0A6U5KY05_9STRA|mmetsp:Transcript_41979/g.98360  ORF Transcript_41979/g.98360 Transcript_41979/m.98360 type:complete len:134 (+) Transcript_41979:361-762(+)|eukprot:CAMPEP_0113300234 /NCGR_PEP_ID=MMETSP0010_2-20120614/1951_1 /TAXON_ID=216773 ORGANISM="Corethron hystrix, Strain 308" /NCGR_SAMPLE_ID=MMETSP0010_2 /ASSEMBLY_ACC=CAM_ASM_000155 /LENGTH=133 /DNA_ID=CAMNT_0000153629 /DNA_START=272 /DNA_END=673 /DNA_ORIENTATION=+ /assembly_acc=CAM_ASM_000155
MKIERGILVLAASIILLVVDGFDALSKPLKKLESRRNFAAKLVVASSSIPFIFIPTKSFARDIGSENASISAAFNAQAVQTNARLVKGGFKLDTKEEEEKKIQDGLASFKYDEAVSKKSPVGRGYNNPKTSTK